MEFLINQESEVLRNQKEFQIFRKKLFGVYLKPGKATAKKFENYIDDNENGILLTDDEAALVSGLEKNEVAADTTTAVDADVAIAVDADVAIAVDADVATTANEYDIRSKCDIYETPRTDDIVDDEDNEDDDDDDDDNDDKDDNDDEVEKTHEDKESDFEL